MVNPFSLSLINLVETFDGEHFIAFAINVGVGIGKKLIASKIFKESEEARRYDTSSKYKLDFINFNYFFFNRLTFP
ncbi:MAG: hypothetical protein QXX30_01760 [Candidatus Aenigmatarchaeota archaeon]